jgi:hypothetical protein
LKNEVCGNHPRAWTEQTFEQDAGQSVRRARHDAELATRQPQICGVALDDCDRRGCEPATEVAGATGMQLDGDHRGASVHKMGGQRTVAGADVKDEFARVQLSVGDESSGLLVHQRMPAPPPPVCGGHDEHS